MKWQIELVIYDCDGVLFDSYEANRRLYNDICANVGRKPLLEEEVKYCHTHTVYESIHYISKGDAELEQRAIDFLKSISLADYIKYLKVEPHLFEALNVIRGRGIKTAINTNRTTTMKHIMERFNLHPYFDMVVTALDVEHPKPHPESIRMILRNLNVDAERALFVGDSEIDRDTALSSGVKFVAYKNRKIATHGSIEDHMDLINFLLDG